MSSPVSSLGLSREEEGELRRSTKKAKESHTSEPPTDVKQQGNSSFTPFGAQGPNISFKDKLIGEIPGAYTQAFDFTRYIENEMEAEATVEVIREGSATVNLSKETKQRIRAN